MAPRSWLHAGSATTEASRTGKRAEKTLWKHSPSHELSAVIFDLRAGIFDLVPRPQHSNSESSSVCRRSRMSLWQCLYLPYQRINLSFNKFGSFPRKQTGPAGGVLLQLCSRPSILLISSTIWCSFWLISTPLMSESNQRKNEKRKLLICCIPVWLRTSTVDWACEVRDHVRNTDSDYTMKTPSQCWLGAVPRYWKVVASCFQWTVWVMTPYSIPEHSSRQFLDQTVWEHSGSLSGGPLNRL